MEKFSHGERRGKPVPLDTLIRDLERGGLLERPADPKAISRRNFLKGAGAVVLTAAAIDNYAKYSTLARFLDDTIGEGQYNYDDLVRDTKAMLLERYNTELLVGPDRPGLTQEIQGDPAVLEKYKKVLRVIVSEFEKYPPEMIKKMAGERAFQIRVLEHLHSKRRTTAGTDPIVGLSIPRENAGDRARIALDADVSEERLRRNVHHELNHQFSDKWQDSKMRDKAWIDFHKKITQTPYGKQLIMPLKFPRFFLSEHASSYAVEDQAIFAETLLIPRSHYAFLEKWMMESDPDVKEVLQMKYNETRRNYREWSGGKIGDEFWIKIIEQGEKEKNTSFDSRWRALDEK